jgi:SAM-dependent methyltransferase
MPATQTLSAWFDLDGGKRARRYTALPYGHYKEEIYPLFGEILDGMGDGIRVLDIGAGPGHLAYEFYKARPRSKVQFALMEFTGWFLAFAEERLGAMGFNPELFQRDFNSPDWNEGLGQFDAIVSNNAVFNLKPELMGEFYGKVHGLLKDNGILLNQQSLGYETAGFKEAIKNFPPALSPLKLMSAEDIQRAERLKAEGAREQAEEEKRIAAEGERLKAQGYTIDHGCGYLSLHVPASEHIRCLNAAGFSADCIWRKMEFVVLAGIKGTPSHQNKGAGVAACSPVS